MTATLPPIGTEPARFSQGDADTSFWSGEFRNRVREDRYRLWRYEATLPQYRIIGWLLVVAAIPFLWTSYQLFGWSDSYMILSGFRLALFGLSVWLLMLARRRASSRALDNAVLAAAILVLTINIMTMYLTDRIGNLMIVQGLMIVTICYVIFPGRLVMIAPALAVFTAALLLTVLTKSSLTGTEVPGVVIWALIANTVGFLAARQFNRFRRIEYVSIQRAEENVAELELARSIAERAQAQAESANRAKSTMLANTSHELRTPLNAIIGFSELIQRQYLGPVGNDRYRQYAEDINGSGKHLLSLIDDLLDLSKIEAGETELHPEWVAVDNIAQESARLTESRARTRLVTIRLDTDQRIGSLWADERALRQILINLLTNAVKFSPVESSVDIRTELSSDGSVRLTVLDRGPGFEPAEIDRLLKPFQQAEADPDRPREGWGLGLALVSAMCRLNGIGLELGNRDAGGARAELTFPAALVRCEDAPPKLTASA